MQLFRPNADAAVLPNDVDAIEGSAKTRERALEALERARALACKHRESRAEGVSVSSRDWTRALSTLRARVRRERRRRARASR